MTLEKKRIINKSDKRGSSVDQKPHPKIRNTSVTAATPLEAKKKSPSDEFPALEMLQSRSRILFSKLSGAANLQSYEMLCSPPQLHVQRSRLENKPEGKKTQLTPPPLALTGELWPPDASAVASDVTTQNKLNFGGWKKGSLKPTERHALKSAPRGCVRTRACLLLQEPERQGLIPKFPNHRGNMWKVRAADVTLATTFSYTAATTQAKPFCPP